MIKFGPIIKRRQSKNQIFIIIIQPVSSNFVIYDLKVNAYHINYTINEQGRLHLNMLSLF